MRLIVAKPLGISYCEIMNRAPSPDDRDWKAYWRDREKDKTHQALTRQAKRDARKRFHKKSRREGKQQTVDPTEIL